ncbi:MAG: hypothetical protein IJE79_00235 [Alphaproteobacteria bacterium]|nr:hypothetical protein [Alphaproteobacteria bacterium]
MKTYTVITNYDLYPDSLFQNVLLKDKAGRERTESINNANLIPTGTKVFFYEYKKPSFIRLETAYSYKINGKQYIQLNQTPGTHTAIKHFWANMGCIDRICLHHDIKKVLRQRKITPTLNRNTNLLLFLNNTIIR